MRIFFTLKVWHMLEARLAKTLWQCGFPLEGGSIITTLKLGPGFSYLIRFNLKELATTETEEKAIATPANIGFNSPRAATGIKTTL